MGVLCAVGGSTDDLLLRVRVNFRRNHVWRHVVMVVAVDQSDLVTESWPKATNQEGNKLRNISYTLSLNYSIGPKVSPTTEKQVLSSPKSLSCGVHVIRCQTRC